jgi:DNA repair exonuclease SbcCD ATPase subunit
MKFESVSFKNYRSYGDNTTHIDLNDSNATILVGSNGVGKSSFVEAIIWCLYGKSLVTMDEVINRITKKDCKVEVNFSVQSDKYSVMRFRSHHVHGDGLLLFLNGDDISKQKKQDTQSLIEEIVGMSYNAFVSSLVFSSEFYTSFLRSTQSARLNIFENVLSMKEIKEYSDIVKKISKPITDELEELNQKNVVFSVKKESILSQIEEYKEKTKKNLISLKIEKGKIEEEIASLNSSLLKEKSINVSLEKEKIINYEKATKQNKEIYSLISELESKIVDTNVIAKNLSEAKEKEVFLQQISIKDEIEKNKKHEQLKSKNLSIKLESQELRSKIVNTSSIKNEIKEIESRVNSIGKELDSITANICSRCKQEINKEITEKLKKDAFEEIKTLNESLKSKKEELIKIENENKKIEDFLNELSGKLIEVPEKSPYSEEQLLDFENQIQKNKNVIQELSSEIIIVDEKNKSTKERIKEEKEKLIDVPEKPSFTIKEIDEMEGIIIKQENELKENERKLKSLSESALTIYDKSYVESMKSNVEKIDKALSDLSKKIDSKKNEEGYYTLLGEVFSNKAFGIKKYIIDKVIGLFNENVNFFLPFFFDKEITIQFDKDLNDTILLDNKEASFMSFSSGEKTRLDLSISFALFMMAKTFFASDINILIFDEILDRNLDDRGVQSVLQIIDNLSKENSVFVISHREEYKEHFANQIFISKDSSGFSKIQKR